MLFQPNFAGYSRLVQAADPAYASAIDPATTGLPPCAPGLRLAPVGSGPVDVTDPLEIAFLLGSFATGAKATALTINQGGKLFYVATDGVSLIDPAALAAVDVTSLFGMGSATVSIGGAALFLPAHTMHDPTMLGPIAFPRWFAV